MIDKILVALAALLGALIPTIFNYLNNKKQRDFEIKKALLERQRQIYGELMLSLQRIINSQINENYLALQESVLQVSIYGDNNTSEALNKYYLALVESQKPGLSPLTREQHQRFHQQILNNMRVSFGLQPLSQFEIVGFRPEA